MKPERTIICVAVDKKDREQFGEVAAENAANKSKLVRLFMSEYCKRPKEVMQFLIG